MEVKLYTDLKAQNYMFNILDSSTCYGRDFEVELGNWLNSSSKRCYTFCEKEFIKNFVLLSEVNHDPLEQHLKPFVLNYIYTFPEFRRKKLALGMLNCIKKEGKITTFCVDEISANLFTGAGYNRSSDNNEMFKYP